MFLCNFVVRALCCVVSRLMSYSINGLCINVADPRTWLFRSL